VALSVLIAMFASYAALDLAGRVTAAGGWTRAVWLLGGAGAMGTGIWSMHYIGMLAFILPIPVAYHWPTVLLSLFAAILASVIALYVVSRQKMGASRAVAGSVLMGAGIASMHYIGMDAMRLPAMCQYNSFLVLLSVVFAVLISLAALWITFHFRDEKTGIGWEKLAGAVVMGAAIPVMHYTGMAAGSFTPSGMPAELSQAVSISTLGTAGIAAVTFIVLGLALLTSWVDRRFAAQTLELQEEKLQRSEAYLAEAQMLSHTGSFGWRISTGETLWSEETFRIFQYDRATKPTMELVLQRVHPEDAALVKQTIERASRDGKDFDHEYRLVMPDGSIKHIHVVAHVLGDESGSIEFVGAVMDVTVAKQSEDRIRQIIDTVPALIWTARPDGSLDFISQRWLDYAGITLEEKQGSELGEQCHPDDCDQFLSKWRAALAEGKPFETETRVKRFDGEYRWFLSRAFPLFDHSGHILGWYGNDVDIHDRKQAEEALRRSEAYLHDAQRVGHTGSWRHDVLSGVVTISPEALRIWGINPDEDSSATEFFFERMHPEDRPIVEQEYWAAILKKADFKSDFRIVLPDGTVKNIHCIGHPILNESSNIVEFVGAVIDVTERRRAEEALRQAQADLAHVSRVTTMGELTASLAHEVNQPIAAAVTNANACLRWLSRDQPDLEEAREAAMRIVKDGTRAAEIISRTRLLFKKGAPQRRLVDVNEVIREMIVLLHSETTRYSTSVRTELATDLPQVMGDRVQLQQVFMNLMLNGIDAMKGMNAGGEITIKSQQGENGQLLISVSDSGVGLPLQEADQIFDAFFTTKRHGTGMGLSISRSIVESHGGRLWAADNSPRGASFYLTLPTGAEAQE
jgi:PAS domain S-box-containing protein